MTSHETNTAVFVWKALNGIAFRSMASSAFIQTWSRLPQSIRNDYIIRAKRTQKGTGNQ